MTSAVPAHRPAPQMTHTPDPGTPSQAPAVDAAVEAPTTRSRFRDEIVENPLLSLFLGLVLALLTFFGTLTVAILLFFLNDINDGLDSLSERTDRVEVSLGERIDGVEAKLGERIDGVEAKLGERIDGVEAKMDAGFAAQGAQVVELDRKLTALIAHLNATEAVDAALEHRLLIPTASTRESESEPLS